MPRKTPRPVPLDHPTVVGCDRKVPLAEASVYANLCTKTMRRYISQGLLTGYRFGPRLIRVDLNEVDALLHPIATVRNVA